MRLDTQVGASKARASKWIASSLCIFQGNGTDKGKASLGSEGKVVTVLLSDMNQREEETL